MAETTATSENSAGSIDKAESPSRILESQVHVQALQDVVGSIGHIDVDAVSVR